MMNPPIEQQLLEGIEQRNDVIARQAARIEALEAELVKANDVIKQLFEAIGPISGITTADVQWAKEKLEKKHEPTR